jgi:hypothetical protein
MSDTPDRTGPGAHTPRAAKAEAAAILSDARLGSSEDERRDNLRRARIQAGILNTVTGAAVTWALSYPRPYSVAITVLAVLPLAGIGLVVATRGAVTLDSDRKNVRPTAAYAVFAPGITLAFRSLEDWHILGWSGFWLPFAVVAGFLLGVLLVGAGADSQRKASTVAITSLVLLAQSYGLVVFLNCQLDRSVPVIHRTVVESRRISRGRRHTSYYLTVSPWIDGGYSEEVTVPSSTYGWHLEGSTVLIGVRTGSLSMPWYFVQ